MTDELVAVLNEGADKNTMVARVLRHAENRPVCPRPEDFWEAMKYDPAVVVRLRADLPCGRVLPIDFRARDGRAEYTHEHRGIGKGYRERFIEDVQRANDIEVLHHRDSQFGAGYRCGNCGTESFDPECESCERRTTHEVSIEMRTESQKQENAEFSREPYRVSECRVCGSETARRMNNA